MDNPTFHLEGIVKARQDQMEDFEGPLSLILLLLSKNKIEIRDVKIAEILDQYLAWLEETQRMDLEIASEFVQMASHLVYIKTRTLLAGTEEVSEMEQLLSSLEQLKSRDTFQAVKTVLPEMGERLRQGALLFSTPQEPLPKYGRYDIRHEPWELLAAFAGMLRKAAAAPEEEQTFVRAIPRPILYSVREKGRELAALLRERGSMTLRGLYALAGSRSELVATFLSLLEMCAAGSVRLTLEEREYRVRFIGGDNDAIPEGSDYG